MRLSEYEKNAILGAIALRFNRGARTYLFGSRLDDQLKGGDIDLFIDLPEADDDMVRHACQAAADIQMAIGEQKIDLIIRHPGLSDQPVFHEALTHGRLLTDESDIVTK
ncbi:nucleotidyltransferase domain-containing protein [Mariprofundus erugo]|uniref:nucleotidyltransferase domain-containing protein n=1 Tax=Mariprofundus erugo TaxID=2528639 RepID=UPI0010FE5070|nr:nucleotidyltransferase domain-containing protein [Mariprofundus erugo]TLS74264.1 nucleotidyltransferase domain-containing protein [Mariprofundus erugo]